MRMAVPSSRNEWRRATMAVATPRPPPMSAPFPTHRPSSSRSTTRNSAGATSGYSPHAPTRNLGLTSCLLPQLDTVKQRAELRFGTIIATKPQNSPCGSRVCPRCPRPRCLLPCRNGVRSGHCEPGRNVQRCRAQSHRSKWRGTVPSVSCRVPWTGTDCITDELGALHSSPPPTDTRPRYSKPQPCPTTNTKPPDTPNKRPNSNHRPISTLSLG